MFSNRTNLTILRRSAALMAVLSAAVMAQAQQGATAITSFTVSATSGASLRGMGLEALNQYGYALSTMVESYLAERGASLVNRSHLDKVVAEMTGNNSGVFDQSTATEIGKLVGARYIVVGQVTDMSLSSKKILVYTELKAKISASVTVIDTATGRTIGGFVDSGSKTQGDLDFEKLLRTVQNDWKLRGVRDSKGIQQFWGSVPGLGDATKDLAQKLAKKLFAVLPKGGPVDGPIVSGPCCGVVLDNISDTEFVIDTKGLGELKAGSKIKVSRVKKEIRDDNGAVKYRVMEEVGEATILDVQGQTCRVQVGSQAKNKLQAQDQVEISSAK